MVEAKQEPGLPQTSLWELILLAGPSADLGAPSPHLSSVRNPAWRARDQWTRSLSTSEIIQALMETDPPRGD